jgi:hypothetical protein
VKLQRAVFIPVTGVCGLCAILSNRNTIINDIGLKRLPFIANSDFRKPKHIYSWKTLMHARKTPKPSRAASVAKNTWPSSFTATSLPASPQPSTLNTQPSTT